MESSTPIQDPPSSAVNNMWLNSLDDENPRPFGNGRAARATGGSQDGPLLDQPCGFSPTDGDPPETSSAHGTDRSQPSRGGLTAGRLREVFERLTSGFYESPEVMHRIAEQLEDELARGNDAAM